MQSSTVWKNKPKDMRGTQETVLIDTSVKWSHSYLLFVDMGASVQDHFLN